MTTSQEMDQQFGDSEIERRLKELERKIEAYEQGGFDIFRQFGYVQLGLNLPRLDKNGMQVAVGSSTPRGAIYFVPAFAIDPVALDNFAMIDGYADDSPEQSGLAMRARAGDVIRAAIGVTGLTSGFTGTAFLNASDPAGVKPAGAAYMTWNTGESWGMFGIEEAVLWIEGTDSDPTTPSDGMIWYRTDTDFFKGRRNGATLNFLMEGDAGGGFLETANTGQFLIPAGPANGNLVASGSANAYGSWTPLPIDEAVAPAAPTETSNSTNVAMPATVAAGDLLIMITAANSAIPGTPAGWTDLGGSLGGGGINPGLRINYKVAAGTEGGTTVSTTGAQTSQVYRILAANYVGVPTCSTAAVGTGAAANPTSVTAPAARFLAIAAMAVQGDLTVSITAAPSGYSAVDIRQRGSGSDTTGLTIGSAYLADSGSSEDPGAFTNGSNPWVAFVVAVGASNAVTEDTYITDVALVPGGTPTYAQIQLGTGAVGAESAIGTLKLTDEGWEKTLQAVIPVTSGTRLSARIATSASADDHFLTLGMLNQDDVA
jgi:hypothetical protein